VAITGVPDSAKGEALVLLTTREIVQTDLREKLVAAGLPNLWIPRRIVRLDAIPILASGKLDLRGCREAALRAVADPAGEA
jgi:acyl-[acyl-carrier-protein]-phospholipid O-acyltransferase/long-chain-fatty-acid--[acyl-carrier-protein] ligase